MHFILKLIRGDILNKKNLYITIFVVFSCMVMAYVDTILLPEYLIKSLIKATLFLIIPITYYFKCKELSIKSLVSINKLSFLYSFLLGICVFVIILLAYSIANSLFDFSGITNSLQNGNGINASNFIFIAIYISFANSLLEEIFFRGFAFLSLKKVSNRFFAYVFSSLAFALYHVTMVISWASIPLVVLLVFSLFVSGIIFNAINERSKNIYSSWFVHMFANFSINTIGLMMFGII